MNTLRVLASPRVWGPVLGVVAVLALVFCAYLGAVVSPEENLEDLPIALVNEDRGGELAGKGINLGDSVVEKITAPDSPAATPVQNVSTGIVSAVSGATSERLSSAAAEQGAQLTPEVAAEIGDPVMADVTEAQPVGPDSGNGRSPFSLAFLVNLSGLVGGADIFVLVGGTAERLEARSLPTSRAGLCTVRLLLAPAGIGISAVLNVILGLAPLEALPPFYDGPLDAVRLEGGWLDSLWFLGGRSEAARLEDAVWMVGAYLVSAATLGYLISLVRRERPTHRKVAKAAG